MINTILVLRLLSSWCWRPSLKTSRPPCTSYIRPIALLGKYSGDQREQNGEKAIFMQDFMWEKCGKSTLTPVDVDGRDFSQSLNLPLTWLLSPFFKSHMSNDFLRETARGSTIFLHISHGLSSEAGRREGASGQFRVTEDKNEDNDILGILMYVSCYSSDNFPSL